MQCDDEKRYFEITYVESLANGTLSAYRDILCDSHMPVVIFPPHFVANYTSYRTSESVCNACYFESRWRSHFAHRDL